ncbi:MAG TPA: TrmH family RNA methyltransferase [Actinomycetota bacterium]|nr:TrmH family RNA methyltransferase [Actinomycetota bacterium]
MGADEGARGRRAGRNIISSTSNRQVASAARLKKRALREKEKRFLAEGAQATAEALDAGAVEQLFHAPSPTEAAHPLVARAEEAGVPVIPVTEQVMTHLTSTVTPQGILAVARFVDVSLAEVPQTLELVPILYAVRDPGNAGTVLRSADAAGADAVVFTDTSVDVYNPKTVRASAGSLFHLPVVRDVPAREAVAVLRQRGLQVLAAAPEGTETVYETDLTRPTAVLFGNEAWGLPAEARALADGAVRIPIRGKSESLNLAAAAALFLFEAVRQRGSGPPAGSIGAAISASAHDIRSSLAALKGFASTLASMWDRLDDADRRTIVGGLAVDAERTASLVKMLVDAARLEEGGFEPSPERHDVVEEAQWVAEVFAQSKDYPEVLVSGGASATVDPERLQVLLLTLCTEAMWWGQGAAIEVSVEPADGGAAVKVHRAVADLSREEVDASFVHPKRGGKGKITLWLARTLAEAQGARLTWEEDNGITFRLELPA